MRSGTPLPELVDDHSTKNIGTVPMTVTAAILNRNLLRNLFHALLEGA